VAASRGYGFVWLFPSRTAKLCTVPAATAD
jgi:hypothetical protein